MVRILCLHGKQQTGEIFEHQLNKLCKALAGVAELDFVDAPCALTNDRAEGDAVVTFSWSEPTSDDTKQDSYAIGDALVQRCMTSSVDSSPYDILLGLSQGAVLVARYVMLRRMNGGDDYGPAVRGIVMAASPDPRRLFPELVTSYRSCMSVHGFPGCGFFGALPSLHIIGRKDFIVGPAESSSFAEACKPHAEVVLHDHAHSIPQLQSVIGAIKAFVERVIAHTEEIDEKNNKKGEAMEEEYNNNNNNNNNNNDDDDNESLTSACEEELEMVSSMYGEECVQRQKKPVVSLPLLLDCISDDAADIPLAALRIRMTLPKRYPAELPKLDVVGGPATRHVLFERWKLELVARTLAYLRGDLGVGNAMLLPAMMFAGEQAANEMSFLRSVVSRRANEFSMEEGGVGTSYMQGQKKQEEREGNVWWEAEEEIEEEVRNAYIVDAEEQAQRILAGKKPLKTLHEASADLAGSQHNVIASRGGMQELTIGLIGKPSAGKSTFFNAVTDPESESKAAKVAAFPFTTIEPNVAPGFAALVCPCGTLSPMSSCPCDAMYGHVPISGTLHRRHPVVLKDVAGLVQGAYKGKGRGNQFLNDLCDANALVHVVDGAAATDAYGSACPPGTGSTRDDITWIRAEVHSWIYDNLRAKWGGIRRKPEKLRTMFTGYRSPPSFVHGVLQFMDIANDAELVCQLPKWGAAELHLLVALYVRLRFPIIVALNKADMRSVATGLHSELQLRYPHEVFLPMSAKVECQLLRLRQKGIVQYVSGDSSFQEVKSAMPAMSPAESKALAEVRHFFTSTTSTTTTGVQEVLAAALSFCSIALVFPTASMKLPLPSLRECFVFKPCSSAGEVFESFLHAGLLDGKLVRFEAVCVERLREGHEATTLKKDAALPGRHVLVRILTNKRQMLL